MKIDDGLEVFKFHGKDPLKTHVPSHYTVCQSCLGRPQLLKPAILLSKFPNSDCSRSRNACFLREQVSADVG